MKSATGEALEVDVPLAAAPSVLFDAVVLAGGNAAVQALSADGRALEFLKDQYRHCKPIMAVDAAGLLDKAGIPQTLPSGEPDPGLLVLSGRRQSSSDSTAKAFLAVLTRHRYFERETDPPRV